MLKCILNHAKHTLKKNMSTCKPTIIQTRQGPQTHLSVVTQTLFLLVAIYWRHNTIQPFVFHYWGKGRYKAIAYAMLFITDGFTFLCPDNYKRLRVVVTQLWKNQDSFPVFFFLLLLLNQCLLVFGILVMIVTVFLYYFHYCQGLLRL